MKDVTPRIAQEMSISLQYVRNVEQMIDEGNTLPFIARYRKELHGSIDDQALRALADRLQALRNLEKRREDVREAIAAQEKLTDGIERALDEAQTLSEIEDIYRPFKPKRRTRATIAREKGLTPLAEIIFAQDIKEGSVVDLAQEYVSEENGVMSAEEAIAGACDIIAEEISDDAGGRKLLREVFYRTGVLTAKALTGEDTVYRLYYDFCEPIKKVQKHQLLAINRGEREEKIKVGLSINEADALKLLYHMFAVPGSITTSLVEAVCGDAWKRLLEPSIEREVRGELTADASEQAIKMFALNLKPLLMQPPIKGRVSMGLDPGYRTGCKVAVVDETGKVLDTGVAYITHGAKGESDSSVLLKRMITKHGVSVIAIGNGTASKETEIFTAKLIQEIGGDLAYMVVNEAGASVYSASKLAAEEFPEYDLTLRSAISIARRLQDPLAELVKIDPKSIGVGQYQHDMPSVRLSESLDGVVEDCVNAVGVDINTASAPLLTRVAGVGASLAKNIVAYREKNGVFRDRKSFLKVPKLGPRAYEQCAGFLRVPESKNVLDNTAVHPESYAVAEKLIELCGYDKKGLRGFSDMKERFQSKDETVVAKQLGVGLPTLRDIINELLKPGRDPRDSLPPPMLRSDVLSADSLVPGMKLTGTVRNVIDFGVFVDIGVHQDGLVHISELCNRFIRHPSEVVKVGDVVDVTVLGVEASKKRISLSMK